MNKDLLEKIDKKLKETRALSNLSSRDFRFKNWHASTINLLKTLPSEFSSYVNNFKKLTFTDTKFHRGARPFNPLDDTKYSEDLDAAVDILKKITSARKESKSVKVSGEKKETGDKKSTVSREEATGKNKKKKTSSPKKPTKTVAKGKTPRAKKSG